MSKNISKVVAILGVVMCLVFCVVGLVIIEVVKHEVTPLQPTEVIQPTPQPTARPLPTKQPTPATATDAEIKRYIDNVMVHIDTYIEDADMLGNLFTLWSLSPYSTQYQDLIFYYMDDMVKQAEQWADEPEPRGVFSAAYGQYLDEMVTELKAYRMFAREGIINIDADKLELALIHLNNAIDLMDKVTAEIPG